MRTLALLSSILLLNLFTMIDTFAQDWPNLERYQQANAQLPSPMPKQNRIVFMGNSITEGWKQDSLQFFDNPAYVNRGISGQTTPQMLIRFRPDVVDLQPTVVVILAGINDIAGNTGPSSVKMIADNIKSMAEIARANGIKVVLSSVLPAADFPWRPGMEPAEKVLQLNSLLKAYAEQHNLIYLDYFSAMVDDQKGLRKAYTYDGVHPNVAGYKVMEPLAEAAIAQALMQK
ncbi:MAG: SGNH/GDSL hydrolase family protein [Bacteroidota bacterium]